MILWLNWKQTTVFSPILLTYNSQLSLSKWIPIGLTN